MKSSLYKVYKFTLNASECSIYGFKHYFNGEQMEDVFDVYA